MNSIEQNSALSFDELSDFVGSRVSVRNLTGWNEELQKFEGWDGRLNGTLEKSGTSYVVVRENSQQNLFYVVDQASLEQLDLQIEN
jgi:hypothetical protein